MNVKYMQSALKEAQKAYEKEEVPVGVVIVKDNKIISRAHNIKEKTNDPCGHAEILAIKKACKKINDWRLEDCDMYVTLEPCMMCAGAILQARIKNVYIGAADSKNGAIVSKLRAFDDYSFNHQVSYETNILEKECSEILRSFFKNLRKR